MQRYDKTMLKKNQIELIDALSKKGFSDYSISQFASCSPHTVKEYRKQLSPVTNVQEIPFPTVSNPQGKTELPSQILVDQQRFQFEMLRYAEKRKDEQRKRDEEAKKKHEMFLMELQKQQMLQKQEENREIWQKHEQEMTEIRRKNEARREAQKQQFNQRMQDLRQQLAEQEEKQQQTHTQTIYQPQQIETTKEPTAQDYDKIHAAKIGPILDRMTNHKIEMLKVQQAGETRDMLWDLITTAASEIGKGIASVK